MFDPKTLYLNRPRTKSIATPEQVLSIPGASDAQRTHIVECCHRLYLKNQKPVNYIEIGVWLGGTFNDILNKCKDIKLYAIGIDLFEDFQVIDDGNTHYGDVANRDDIENKLKTNGHTNFTLIKGDSVKVIDTLEKMENVVCFIDGNHTYEAVKKDFYSILPKISNGYIIFDDLDWISIHQFFEEIQKHFRVVFRDIRTGIIKIN